MKLSEIRAVVDKYNEIEDLCSNIHAHIMLDKDNDLLWVNIGPDYESNETCSNLIDVSAELENRGNPVCESNIRKIVKAYNQHLSR